MKQCTKCKQEKAESEFYKEKRCKTGLDSWCKSCRKDNTYRIRKENPELRKQYENTWISDHKEKIKVDRHKYYIRNKDKENHNSKEWRNKNSEHVRIRDNLYRKKRRKIDPLYRLKTNMRSMLNRAFKRHGYTKRSRSDVLIGCSYEELLKYMGPEPEYQYDIDHICPCAQAQNEDELIKLQHYTNLRWMLSAENESKSDKWTSEGEELCRKLLEREWIYETKNIT